MIELDTTLAELIIHVNRLEAKIDTIIELSKVAAPPSDGENEIDDSSPMLSITNFKLPSQRRAEYQRKLIAKAHVQQVDDGTTFN
jgi:hypothetical protein